MNASVRFLILMAFLLIGQVSASECLKVGLLGEFTRPTGNTDQPFGQEILRGINLAQLQSQSPSVCVQVSEIDIENSIANIPGHIERSAKSGTHVFIGLGISEQALLALTALDNTKSILLSPTASSNQLTSKSNRIILLFPQNSHIANKLATEAKKRGYKKIIAVYAPNNAYSVDLFEEFEKSFTDTTHVLVRAEVRAGAANAESVVNQIRKNSDYDAVFLPLFELDVARILSGLALAHIQVKEVIGTDSWGTYAHVIANLTNKLSLKGFEPEIYNPDLENIVNRQFNGGYQEKYKRLPTDLAAFSFDALTLAIKMAEQCGLDAAKWSVHDCARTALPFNSTTGIIGHFENGALRREVRVKNLSMARARVVK